MAKLSPDKSDANPWLTGEYVIYWGLIWSIVSLILYLNFSVVDPQSSLPWWFHLSTTALEEIGLLVSGYLCWRNYRSKYIAGGRAVWLLFAIAMLAFFVGNLWFYLWEVLWGLAPAASAGNIFYILFYLILIAGMRLAILDRDVQLARQQWVAVIGVMSIGLTMGCWLTTLSAKAVTAPPSLEISLERSIVRSGTLVASRAPQIPDSPQDRVIPARFPNDGIGSFQSGKPTMEKRQNSESRQKLSQRVLTQSQQIDPSTQAPDWVLAIDRAMHPLVDTFNLFYVLCDLVLLTFAVILLLGFWGGQLGLPWRTTAQAVLCFYIADTWFAYANNRVQGYESGFIMEVFWIFGIVQFGIAAALEFDNSIRARRLARRRTAIK
ncbi:hypothetical protein [Chamaesiphon minutus]|uniref:Uncharacterized protein n=1 Tax=Chamaesiphon minutus (strain ATCC 27169 / PCC 6605) TaxID=1173020 RepID=K9UM66_CHAP6|nr:hypothetical protein [Chamaesiphon minutus]AFY95541.1 hypothetical protein Cha6605_4623 [Chamaesiphon minutus PCC 6605]